MKSLLSVLALSGALCFAVGCGPQEAFCPNTSAKDAGGVCPIIGDDAITPTMDMKVCGQGQYLGDNPDGNPESICLCATTSMPPPCP